MSWVHVGDIHASAEDGWESIARLQRIIQELRIAIPRGALDFIYLPGDNANHGEPRQYELIREALRMAPFPVYAVPGDHDFEPGSLDAYQILGAPRLPCMERFEGRRALFLDIVSAGSGGPDFRIGDAQFTWLRGQLKASKSLDEPHPVVFMHAFPSDLQTDSIEVTRLLAKTPVAMVDTGHTHYNELLNDGKVIYAATRSTGQLEEGTFGYSIAAIDDNITSWRFKEINTAWPWVLITAPADSRLATADQMSSPEAIRALVLGPNVKKVEYSLDGGPRSPMLPLNGRPGRWSADLAAPLSAQGLAVIATNQHGTEAVDEVQITGDQLAKSWPEHGVLGTRLGPNANGRKW